MRVLLNTTTGELAFTGGDNAYYRTLMILNGLAPGYEFALLKHTPQRLRRQVRQLEVLAVRFPLPSPLKRQLLAQARRVPICPADLKRFGAAVVFSTVLAARPMTRQRVPQVWYSQGISPAAYYDYFGWVSINDVAGLYRLVAPHVSLIVVGTHDCALRLQEMCPDLPCPVVVVPQLTLIEPLSGLADKPTDEPIHLLFVGRDYIRKGLPELLAAYRRLRSAWDSTRLHVVTSTDCPLPGEFADLSSVSWYSDLSDEALCDLYRKCHVLVVPTNADTYNLVLVEAMAFGCAIVSSNLAPLDEIAPNREVGLLVPCGNVDAISQALEALTTDAHLLRQCMQGALERYQSVYAPQVVIPQLLAAFEQAVALVQ